MVTGRLRQRSSETPEGDKRSVTEIEADEVGASLKSATAKMERTSQGGNGDRAQGRKGRPNLVGTSAISRHSDQSFEAVSAPGFGRGRYLLSAAAVAAQPRDPSSHPTA